jgi:hypothetical protein
MTNKEKEKFWLTTIKELAQNKGWKFKSYFIFKLNDNLFFSTVFFINPKTNELNASLGYKTYSIDNVFWDIINEEPNKKMPLSFRANAAFCVREFKILEEKIKIEDEEKPQNDISELIQAIELLTQKKCESIKSSKDFIQELFEHEEQHTVGIITGLIEQNLIENALAKISEYKAKNYSSGFGFEDNKDFYDLAKEYCQKNNR